ncbi:unnamed protein product [Closterium sp. NIES-54]
MRRLALVEGGVVGSGRVIISTTNYRGDSGCGVSGGGAAGSGAGVGVGVGVRRIGGGREGEEITECAQETETGKGGRCGRGFVEVKNTSCMYIRTSMHACIHKHEMSVSRFLQTPCYDSSGAYAAVVAAAAAPSAPPSHVLCQITF